MLRMLVCCFCLNFVQVFSQDFHFTQYNRVGILVNPAITGVFGGWERFCVSHRNQWLGANTQFTTSSASATRSTNCLIRAISQPLWDALCPLMFKACS